jgi:hypothetical protein
MTHHVLLKLVVSSGIYKVRASWQLTHAWIQTVRQFQIDQIKKQE